MARKKSSGRKSPNQDIIKSQKELIEALTENNVMLTKKSAEVVSSVKKMTERVDKLVEIFEKASKDVGKVQSSDEMIQSLSTKLTELLEQNKTIASGLIALEQYVRKRSETVTQF